MLIKKIGNAKALSPADNPWESFFKSLDQFSADFMTSRGQPEQYVFSNPKNTERMLSAMEEIDDHIDSIKKNTKKTIIIKNKREK